MEQVKTFPLGCSILRKYFEYKIKCLLRETLNYVAREEAQRPATLATFSLPVFKHKINIMVLLTFCKKASLHNAAADIYFKDKEGTSSGKPCILAPQATGFILTVWLGLVVTGHLDQSEILI